MFLPSTMSARCRGGGEVEEEKGPVIVVLTFEWRMSKGGRSNGNLTYSTRL
jgi:hypothetical protein